MIRNKNIASRCKRLWIPVNTMAGHSVDRASSLANGVPIYQAAVAAAEVSGLAMAAAGDEIAHFMPIPWDIDRNEPMRYRIWFCHASTDADTPDWLISITYMGKQVLIPAADASADESLAFPATAVAAVADALEVTRWVESASHTKMAETDFAMMMLIECNGLGSASANEIELLGIEIEYTLGGLSEGNRLVTSEAPITDTRVDSGADYYI